MLMKRTENFNALKVPPNTPLSLPKQHPQPRDALDHLPPSSRSLHPPRYSSGDALAGWQQAVEQPTWQAPLVAKPVAPIAVLKQAESEINVTQVEPGRFFVDLGRNVQV
jgi:hypothetical protein